MRSKTIGMLIALGLLAWGGAWATTMIRLEEKDLWHVADTIVIGRVPLPPKPIAQPGAKAVFSKVTILVDEYVAAKPMQKEIGQIELVLPGGSSAGRTTVVPGMPSFRQDERVLLFLRRDPRTDRFNLVGLSQGKFEIRQEEGTGREYLVPSSAQVDLLPVLSAAGRPADSPAVSQATKPTAASPQEASKGAPVRRYLDDVVGQIKAYKRLKGDLDP